MGATTTLTRTAKIEIRKSTNGQFYWRYVATNGEVLCTSETYMSKQGAQNGIQSLRDSISRAETIDLT